MGVIYTGGKVMDDEKLANDCLSLLRYAHLMAINNEKMELTASLSNDTLNILAGTISAFFAIHVQHDQRESVMQSVFEFITKTVKMNEEKNE